MRDWGVMVDVSEVTEERLGGVVQGGEPYPGLEGKRFGKGPTPVELVRHQRFTAPASITADMIASRVKGVILERPGEGGTDRLRSRSAWL